MNCEGKAKFKTMRIACMVGVFMVGCLLCLNDTTQHIYISFNFLWIKWVGRRNVRDSMSGGRSWLWIEHVILYLLSICEIPI